MRFRQYVHGQKVVVEWDHKPLVGLLDKPLAFSPRIQRMRLQRFDLKVVYNPGKDISIAGTLHRALSPFLYEDDVKTHCEEKVHHILTSIVLTESTRRRHTDATSRDPTLQLLWAEMDAGLLEHKRQFPAPVEPYWPERHNLTSIEVIVLVGTWLVVLFALRKEALDSINVGHFGESKCVLRAWSCVYRPGWEEQVSNAVVSCGICQEHRHRNSRLPLFPVRLSDYASQLVSADLFEFSQVPNLLLVDVEQ